ncbi:hypothetical protein ACWC4E_29910 [Streptomyces sp. NPDC001273]|uniref:hypothetical protein n=1 Tax=unclassified Streptomyces TaxID=2593676 RepID=UPI0033C43DEC
MVSGFTVAGVLTMIYPDDIRVLGSITGGIIGFAVNLAVFLIVSALTGQSAQERQRVAQLFEARQAVRTPGRPAAAERTRPRARGGPRYLMLSSSDCPSLTGVTR